MQTFKKEIVPQTTRTVQVSRTCDLCGVDAKNILWGDFSCDFDETEVRVSVKQKEGTQYPEGGSGTECEIDICPKCFKDRLVPWLISQGANIERKDWDW